MSVSVVLLAAALSAGNAEFDRTAAEGAARISAARFAAEMVRRGPDADALAKAMLDNPDACASRRAAEGYCRDLFEKSLDSTFLAEASAIRRRLGLDDAFVLRLSDRDLEALRAGFAPAFESARKTAVAEQAKTLAATTRPSEEEFESKDEVDLRREMTERVLAEQKTAVFEENRRYVSEELVAPIIASGWEERNRQGEYLRRARTESGAPARLAQELVRKLEANVADHNRGLVPTKAWGVFPSVRAREVPAQVERRLTDRFVRQVESEQVEISAEDIMSAMAKDPAAHAKASDSEKAFAATYSGRILDHALERALADVPAEDRADLQAFLGPRLKAEAFGKAVDRVVRREVRPKWKAAREQVAKRLAETTWPTLADGTWFPGAELADAVSARSDYGEAVKAWRKLSEMASLARADADKTLLEESQREADARVAEAFERARNAIAAQSGIVDEVHPDVLAEAKKRPTDLKTVEGLLVEATDRRWNERRLEVLWPKGERPANANDQHASLFPSVLKKIELVARQILEEVAQEQQAKQEEQKPEEAKPEQPPEEKPEEPPPEETPPDEEPPEDDLFSLSVKRTGKGLEIKLLQGKKVVQESFVPAKANDFRKAMEALTDTLSEKVLNLR